MRAARRLERARAGGGGTVWGTEAQLLLDRLDEALPDAGP